MCPPSSLPDWDVILEKFLLVSNLHCAGGGVITQSDLSVLVSHSVSAFLSFFFFTCEGRPMLSLVTLSRLRGGN